MSALRNPQHDPYITVNAYFALEAASEIRYEYDDGQVVAMAGASRSHNRICTNGSASLHGQLRRRCDVYQSDMRVRVSETRYVYPDVVAVCGERRFVTMGGLDTLTNPTLIVEVLSESTQDYDESEKIAQYQTIASVTDIVLVSQIAVEVTHLVRRNALAWQTTIYHSREDVIRLDGVEAMLALADVYESIGI